MEQDDLNWGSKFGRKMIWEDDIVERGKMEKPFTSLEKVTFNFFSSRNLPFTAYAKWSRFIGLHEADIVAYY